MNQSQVYMHPFTLESPSHFPPHPTPLGSHRAPDLSSLCYTADFHWLSNFTHGNVYVSMLLSQFVPPSSSPSASTSLFSMSASVLLPCRQFHQYHLSGFHIYAILHSVSQALGSFTLLELSQMHSFLQLSNISLCIRVFSINGIADSD